MFSLAAFISLLSLKFSLLFKQHLLWACAHGEPGEFVLLKGLPARFSSASVKSDAEYKLFQIKKGLWKWSVIKINGNVFPHR